MQDIQTRRLFAVASVALRYPTEDWLNAIGKADLSELQDSSRKAVSDLLNYFASTSLLDLQMRYVEVFDQKRKACLYLSYYLNGDTRARGMALVHFKDIYREQGWEIGAEELPDHLPMFLEFIAVTKSNLAWEVLRQHKAGIALLEKALEKLQSPYASLIGEILKVIPGDATTQTLRLIQKGPEVELVGLAPYGESITSGGDRK